MDEEGVSSVLVNHSRVLVGVDRCTRVLEDHRKILYVCRERPIFILSKEVNKI